MEIIRIPKEDVIDHYVGDDVVIIDPVLVWPQGQWKQVTDSLNTEYDFYIDVYMEDSRFAIFLIRAQYEECELSLSRKEMPFYTLKITSGFVAVIPVELTELFVGQDKLKERILALGGCLVKGGIILFTEKRGNYFIGDYELEPLD